MSHLPKDEDLDYIMSQLLGQGVQGEAMEAAQNVLLPMEVKIYYHQTSLFSAVTVNIFA